MEDQTTQDPDPTPTDEPAADPLFDEATTIGVDDGRGNVSYVTGVSPEFYRQRRINYAGDNMEHVAEGVQGIWIYRQM